MIGIKVWKICIIAEKSVILHRIFAKTLLIIYLTDYESIRNRFHFNSRLKEAVNKFRGILTDNGAEIINEENWGLKKLAYAIENKSTGFYILMEFKAQPEVIKTLEVNFRRDEKVLRFLTIKMEKYAAEYAEKRRNNKSKKED